MRGFVASACICLASLLIASTGSAAGCDVPALAGAWENPRASEDQDITRVEIAHICQTGLTGGRAVLTGSEWTVRAFSLCRPRDCKWGREPGQMSADGQLIAVFPTFSALRTVRIRHAGHAVYVDIDVDYHDERTKDRKHQLVLVAAD